jgi:peptidoglycan/LPS O-acetylase OafA/YrhL
LGLVALAASSGLNVLLDGRPGLEALPFSTALVSQVSVGRWLGVFAGGIFSSFCYVYVLQVAPAHLRDSLYLRPTATLLPAAGVALALGIAFLPALRAMPLKPLFFGAAYTLLLLGVLFGTPSLRRPFEGRVTRFIGLISYSFYIWHWVLMEALIPKELPPLGIELVVALRFLIGLGLAALVAYISYQLCERPFLRARRRAREAPAA